MLKSLTEAFRKKDTTQTGTIRIHYEEVSLCQDSQVIPGYFSSNANCHSKHKKSSKTKLTQLGEDTFLLPQFAKIFLNIYNFYQWVFVFQIATFGLNIYNVYLRSMVYVDQLTNEID